MRGNNGWGSMRSEAKIAQAIACVFCMCSATLLCSAALAQNSADVDRINSFWDNLDKRYPNLNKKYQTGDIQVPGKIQTPGNIQIPRGIQAITRKSAPCTQRFVVGADTLFEFDKSTLTPFAVETLKVLSPMIQKLGPHPVKVEGHTDGKGTEEYNQTLSEKRAERVKNWLLENHVAPVAAVSTEGFGKRKPVAPNTKPDGSDNPQGRALNRRVEIVVDTCKSVEDLAKTADGTATPAGTATGGSEQSSTADPNSGPASLAGVSDDVIASSSSPGKLGLDSSDSGSMNLTGSVDNSIWLPYTNVVSAEDMKKNYASMKITPFNNQSLYFEISLPANWKSKEIEVPADVLKNDSTTQVPLAQLEPDTGNAIVEVRYLRVPEDVPLSRFIQKYADASDYKLVTRQHAQFSEREVEDALLRKPAGSFGNQLTRLTALRKGPLVLFVASSCPEKEYEQWKRIFAAAALTFNPSGK
ncbi:MAG: OmpA family protein [Candidatus Obscuribacterales bacterium]|nr:OmpA family protein [Candidatus Obscuribacterales bacterium]